ncbi:MAG: tRNA (N6-threonylcarbamoyladenosine(37)-N6)-methyltransferase TrmO [Verrucomicrobiota bacterium]
MTIDPIGVIRSCFGGKFAAPRQPGLCPSAWGSLVLHDPYRSDEAVRGIEGFSHLWLIFGFHQTLDQGWHPTVRPPRLGGNQRLGVFASRSPFRPNGLGLSLVRLEGIDREPAEAPVLRLGGLDLIDGTPVFDIKPYLPYAECPPDAAAGFAGEAPPRLPVTVHQDAFDAFARLPARAQAVLREALALDPRPATQTTDATRVFGADLCGCNVRFTIAGGICQIVEIEGHAAL